MRIKAVATLILLGFLFACRSEHESMVEKADREALNQKSQLALYLYLPVIETRKERDDIRYRALKGLAQVSATQLNDYREAARALDTIFEEFSGVDQYANEIRMLRMMAAKIWRINLEKPSRALDVLSPMIDKKPFTLEFGAELGRVYLALNDYNSASHWFTQSLELAKREKNCDELKSLQLDLIQVYAIQDKCNEVFELSEMTFPAPCTPDEFSVTVEKANCFEIKGEVAKATEIYQEMIKKDPKNLKAHFLLESLKRRQKQKLTR